MARKTAKTEKVMLGSVLLLAIFGLVVLASTSVPLSQQNFGESYYYFRHQLIFGFTAGVLLFFIARKISPKGWKMLALPLYVISLVLLALVFIPEFSYSAGGARRWLAIAGISFQPAELAKFALVLYLAAWLDKRKYKITKNRSTFFFLIIVGFMAGLIALQPDIGTAALIMAIGLVLYFAAGARLRTIVLVILLAAVLLGSFIALNPERLSRVLGPFNPFVDVQGENYQLHQALIAIGSGGFFGRGLGHSIQKYQYLPESIGDAIFAIIAEEFGFLVTTIFLGVFVVFIITGFKIALAARTRFGTLLGIGIVSWIGLQALINIGGITGIFPLTGMPLPFISYGGTALALELGAVGILSSIARN